MKTGIRIGICAAMASLAGMAGAVTINGTVDMDFEQISAPGGGVSYTYQIGKTEVSVAQYEGSGLHTNAPNYNVHGSGVTPTVNISWHQAAEYANWLTSGDASVGAYDLDLGGIVTNITPRNSVSMNALVGTYGTVYLLPTKEEWFKAAYYTGSGTNTYANVTDTLPINEVDAVYSRNQGDGPWAVTNGSAELSGTLNMMGNVFEWLESTEDGNPYDSGDGSQQMAFYGGSWFQGAGLLESNSLVGDERDALANVGMRIVAVPEPGTLSLMGLSTMGLFAARSFRRRRLYGRSLLPLRRERFCDSFCTEEEWAAPEVEMGPDALSLTLDWLLMTYAEVKTKVMEPYRTVDEKFWDYMVASHERRLAKRKAAREALKKKSLDCLDAFLDKIFK